MMILIAPEKDVDNEITILNQLFEAGLECYHLRKPIKSYEEHCVYLNQIDSAYHARIVVHFFHELIDSYPLKGIHFQEQKRRKNTEFINRKTPRLKQMSKTVSSSFHEIEELRDCKIKFDYHLLSPVFSSISKKGYEGRGFDVNHIDKTIVGMGGINTSTLTKVSELGFKGIGVLGAVWNAKNPLSSFKELKENYSAIKK